MNVLFAYLLFAAAGAIGGLVFWLIRRPDQDGKRAADQRSGPSSGSNSTSA
jgi:hypothetical protein